MEWSEMQEYFIVLYRKTTVLKNTSLQYIISYIGELLISVIESIFIESNVFVFIYKKSVRA